MLDAIATGSYNQSQVTESVGAAQEYMIVRLINALHAAGAVYTCHAGKLQLTALGQAVNSWQHADKWLQPASSAKEWLALPALVLGTSATPDIHWAKLLQQDDEYAERFSTEMSEITMDEADAALAALAAACHSLDWQHVHCIVDLGGGTGWFLSHMLEALHISDSVHAYVLELPQVASCVQNAPSNRIQFVEGDFFINGDIPAADVYLLKVKISVFFVRQTCFPLYHASELISCLLRAVMPS